MSYRKEKPPIRLILIFSDLKSILQWIATQKTNFQAGITLRFARAVFEDTLRLNNETASASEYQKMKISADESRIEAELARLELKSHIEQHRCGHGPE